MDVLSNASEADCSPEADAQSKALEQGSLLLTEVEVDAQQFTLTCVAETQTDPVCCKGPLQLMLSATDGTHGSTQVTHVAQADKVRRKDGRPLGQDRNVVHARTGAGQALVPAQPAVYFYGDLHRDCRRADPSGRD